MADSPHNVESIVCPDKALVFSTKKFENAALDELDEEQFVLLRSEVTRRYCNAVGPEAPQCGGPKEENYKGFVSRERGADQDIALLLDKYMLIPARFLKTVGLFDKDMILNCPWLELNEDAQKKLAVGAKILKSKGIHFVLNDRSRTKLEQFIANFQKRDFVKLIFCFRGDVDKATEQYQSHPS